MFKHINEQWFLLIIIGLILSNCSTIPNQLNNRRPEWTYSLSEKNKTTDEINFVGISYPTENLDDARFNAMLNAGNTVINEINSWNNKSYAEISSRKGVCVEFEEWDSIFFRGSVHGALQVMSTIKLNEVYVEKESDKSKNHVVFVKVGIKKNDLNALRLTMAEESARIIEGRIEESEFLSQQRKRAAEAFRESGVVELDKIKNGINIPWTGTFDDYVEWRKCKAILQERKQAARQKATEEAKKQSEAAIEMFRQMSKDGFMD